MSDFLRLIVVLVGAAVLVVGIVLVRPVVTNIAKFATAPESMSESAESFGRLIGADELVVPMVHAEQSINIGKATSVSMLMFAHIMWMWVPLGMIRAGGSILLSVAKSYAVKRDLPEPMQA
jgi:hypothetical protein